MINKEAIPALSNTENKLFEADAATVLNQVRDNFSQEINHNNMRVSLGRILKECEHDIGEEKSFKLKKTLSELDKLSPIKLEIDALKTQVTSLQEHKDQIKTLIDNDSYANVPLLAEILPSLRSSFRQRMIELKREEQKFTEEDELWLDDIIQQNIDTLQKGINRLNSAYKEKVIALLGANFLSYPLIWGKPKHILSQGQQKDAFIYSGKTAQKTVYKPFTAIHQSLVDANWRMRLGRILDKSNYLTVHLLFTVSDRPHIIHPETKKFTGGRTYIDFPFALPLMQLAKEQTFLPNEERKMPFSQTHSLGTYHPAFQKIKDSFHTERALKSLFLEENTVTEIVHVLKARLEHKYGDAKGFKVYEINLFLNSNRSICEQCEQILHSLQLPPKEKDDRSNFLALLKNALIKQNFKTLTKANHTYPRMFLSVSAYDFSSTSGSFNGRLRETEEININFDKQNNSPAYAIDTKLLAGQAILITYERVVTALKIGKNCGYEQQQSTVYQDLLEDEPFFEIPFYTGFRSTGGISNNFKEEVGKPVYRVRTPSCGYPENTIPNKYKRPFQITYRAPISFYLKDILAEAKQEKGATQVQKSSLKRESNTLSEEHSKRQRSEATELVNQNESHRFR